MFVYVAVLIAGSLTWCCRLILRAPLGRRHQALLCAAVFCATFLVGFDDFGQREHFLIIFSMPLIVMTAMLPLCRVSWQERVLVALFALPGLALKPFFLAAPFLMTMARIALERGTKERLKVLLSPENLAIGVGCVAYLAFVWIRHPAYIEVIVPLARATYAGIEHDLARPMQLAALAIMLLVPLVLFLHARSAPMVDRPVLILF